VNAVALAHEIRYRFGFQLLLGAIESGSLRYIQLLIRSEMTKAQMPKFMRQSGELHSWSMILVDLHSIKLSFFFGARTSNDSNRARPLVTCIDRVPLNVLLDNCFSSGADAWHV